MPTPTLDYQVSIGPLNGSSPEFLLGPGTPYLIDKFLGLDLDDFRTDDQPRSQAHGSEAGRDLLGSRDLTLDVYAFGVLGDAATTTTRTPELAWTNMDDLVGAWAATSLDTGMTTPDQPDMVLRFKVPGQPVRRFLGRARKVARNDTPTPFGYATATLQFTALDPRSYADTVSAASVAVTGTTTGGLTFPATFPVTFGASSDGQLTVRNIGNFSTRPTLTITGPITNPRVENLTDGTFIQVNLALAGGEPLTIDSPAERILLGGASRLNLLAVGSTFTHLRKGTTDLRLTGVVATGNTPTLSVSWRATWL